jgi:hypothetical protein
VFVGLIRMGNGATMEKNLFSFSKHVAGSVGSSPIIDRCRYQPNRPCFHGGHCGIFYYATCNVECCFLHLRPSARFQRRKLSEVGF